LQIIFFFEGYIGALYSLEECKPEVCLTLVHRNVLSLVLRGRHRMIEILMAQARFELATLGL
jgi:hypothetical protein